jgi:head-tail adaptor
MTNIRAGTLDARIAMQRKGTSLSSSGSPIESWSNLAIRWSNMDPLIGDAASERNASQQWVAREQVKFTVRWSPDLDNFSPLDRIIFPATDAGLSPMPVRSIYDVISVSETRRHVGFSILAARRTG